MKKRVRALLLACVMAVALLPATALAALGPDPDSFGVPYISELKLEKRADNCANLLFYLEQSENAVNAYDWYMENGAADGEASVTFSDVPADAWYATYVKETVSAGVLKGKGNGMFAPADNMTIAEAITLAARMDALLQEIEEDPADLYAGAGVWYQPYVEYAKDHNLPWQYADYGVKITRSEFAHIFATVYQNNKTLYDEAGVVPMNEVRDGAIPDVPMTLQHAEDIYTLYRMGVLTGSDSARNFRPNSNIQRCEVAAIVLRLGEPDYLQSFTLK